MIYNDLQRYNEMRKTDIAELSDLSDIIKRARSLGCVDELLFKKCQHYAENIHYCIADRDNRFKRFNDLIDFLSNRDYKLIIRGRLVENRTWKEIAENMHYTTQWVQELHKRALKEFERILETA